MWSAPTLHHDLAQNAIPSAQQDPTVLVWPLVVVVAHPLTAHGENKNLGPTAHRGAEDLPASNTSLTEPSFRGPRDFPPFPLFFCVFKGFKDSIMAPCEDREYFEELVLGGERLVNGRSLPNLLLVGLL